MNAISPLGAGQSSSGATVGGKVRVFVVDDSSMVRAVYSRVIAQDPGLELIGTAISGEDALAQLAGLHVHVVLLDLEMPGMGGMKALPEIIRKTNGAKVMVVSTLTSDGAEATVEALSRGAADTLQKPASGTFDDAYRAVMIQKIVIARDVADLDVGLFIDAELGIAGQRDQTLGRRAVGPGLGVDAIGHDARRRKMLRRIGE